MERELGVMEQLNYLFYYNEVHRFSEMDEIVREVVKMHEEFIESEDFIRAYEIERERSLIAAKMQRAKDNGISQGKHEEKIINAKKLIQIFYNVEETQWIEKCKDEQLDKIYNIINQVDYEEFKKHIQE